VRQVGRAAGADLGGRRIFVTGKASKPVPPGPLSAVLPSAQSPVSQPASFARQRWPQPGTRDLYGDKQEVHHDRTRTWPPPV